MGTSHRRAFTTDADFRDLDEDARRAIASVADAVSAAAGFDADDARRAAVKAHVSGSWKRGLRLPLDLVSAGFDGVFHN